MRIIYFLLFLLMACGSATETNLGRIDSTATVEQEANGSFQPIRDSIVEMNTSSGFGYALYLPKSYQEHQNYPVIFFFDPHATGALPLQHYRNLANQYGLIFIGSNTSKNGEDLNRIRSAHQAVLADAKQKLAIDLNRIYLCGFSGGGRVACELAKDPLIAGVIACSASPGEPLRGDLAFAGVAGIGDMNYLELRIYMQTIKKSTAPAGMYLFNGTHAWPPLNTFTMAMGSVLSWHPQVGLTNTDSLIAEMYSQIVRDQFDSLENKDCELALELGAQAIRVLQKFPEKKGKWSSSVQRINGTPCIQSAANRRNKIESEEKKLQEEIANSVLQRDTIWWKANSKRLFETSGDGASKAMHQRVQGYASLMCYSYANRALKSTNPHAAEHLIAVYRIVDPENSEWAIMQAILSARLQLNDRAFEALDRALDLGFKDKSRLESTSDFSPLRTDARWLVLINRF